MAVGDGAKRTRMLIARGISSSLPVHLQKGTRLGPYEIVAPIGAGGMGEVYRARDTRLDRTVAIKILPQEVAQDTAFRMRFAREAKAISALNHPNICTLYDVGDSYLVMEFCEGVTLADRIAQGPLPPDEAMKYGSQIADALEKAHRHGIVHRDLKPSNIMVTSSGVKLLDFGLAKQQATGPSESETTLLVTGEGVIIGTVPYMAPELLRGHPADARSDLFALGVILYEMLTGKRPFEGKSRADLIAAILEREPLPLTDQNRATPPALDLLIQACLSKDPEDRIQTANDVRRQLGWISDGTARPQSARAQLSGASWSSGRGRSLQVIRAGVAAALLIGAVAGWLYWRDRPASAAAPVRSLVVLPFNNRSNPDDQYFAAGMHDGVIGELSQIASLRVISRTSALHYQGTQKSIPEIARELNIEGVVEGSVSREGELVRIRVALFRVQPEERQIYAHTYERGIRDVLSIHSDIARALASAMNAPLTTVENGRLSTSRRVAPEPYEAYLKGMFDIQKLTPAGIQSGLEHLLEAVNTDPSDPLAQAGLALAYSVVGHGPTGRPDDFVRAKVAANKSLALDETTAEAHAALAGIALYDDWDWRTAEREFRRTLELSPNFAQAHRDYAWLLFQRHRADEPLAALHRARQLDPRTALYGVDLGWMYWSLGRADDAIEAAQAAIALDKNFDMGHFMLAVALAAKGLHQQSIAAAERAASINPAWKGTLAYVHARAGHREEALRIAGELGKSPNPLIEFLLAETYATLGRNADALMWLRRAEQSRFSWIPWIHRDPALVPLHKEPEFQRMAARLKLPPVTR
jgi:serine/threonine-protein kinase